MPLKPAAINSRPSASAAAALGAVQTLQKPKAVKPGLTAKVWHEAVSDEGYTYYWNIETNGELIYFKNLSVSYISCLKVLFTFSYQFSPGFVFPR